MSSFFHEISVVPTVLAAKSYQSQGERRLARAHVANLVGPTTSLRNLHSGAWLEAARQALQSQDPEWSKILQYWRQSGALKEDSTPGAPPRWNQSAEWVASAVRSHERRRLACVVCPPGYSTTPQSTPPVLDLADAMGCSWVLGSQEFQSSILVSRSMAGLENLFDGVFQQSRSCMIVDAYLDPSQSDYRQLGNVLRRLSERHGPLSLVFHRSSRLRGRDDEPGNDETLEFWRERFSKHWHSLFAVSGIKATVGLWADISSKHDRHIVTARMGLHCGHGFSERILNSGRPEEMTVSLHGGDTKSTLWKLWDVHAHRHDATRFRGAFTFGS